jgi:glc operon protein GlcG
MTATRQHTVITVQTALDLLQRAVAEGARQGVAVSVTVVDPSMNLVAFAMADGATPHSVESSRRKANTAASTRRPSGWMSEDLALSLPMATDLKLTNITGGFPLVYEGTVAGAVGIAGGTPDQDAQIAESIVVHAAAL